MTFYLLTLLLFFLPPYPPISSVCHSSILRFFLLLHYCILLPKAILSAKETSYLFKGVSIMCLCHSFLRLFTALIALVWAWGGALSLTLLPELPVLHPEALDFLHVALDILLQHLYEGRGKTMEVLQDCVLHRLEALLGGSA